MVVSLCETVVGFAEGSDFVAMVGALRRGLCVRGDFISDGSCFGNDGRRFAPGLE